MNWFVLLDRVHSAPIALLSAWLLPLLIPLLKNVLNVDLTTSVNEIVVNIVNCKIMLADMYRPFKALLLSQSVSGNVVVH